jgi:hypothetical protein
VTSSDQCGQPGLAQRMRAAADAIEAFNRARPHVYGLDYFWRPSELRCEAEHVEAEEREKAEREVLVDQFARDLFAVNYPNDNPVEFGQVTGIYRCRARKLLDAGWHK